MPIPFNESAISGRHTVSYRTLDAYHGNPSRDIEVLATRGEIEALMRDGFLVRHNLLDAPTVELLRASLEEVLARETDIAQGDTAFGGVFLRHLADKHPMVLELLAFAPALGVARAVFGPVLALRGLDARLCSSGQQHSEVEWHHHQRVIPQPLPPMWCRPQSLDALIYLDDIDENNRPLFVVPGSHQWLERELPAGQKDDRADQQQITFGAGSMVLMFGSLWQWRAPDRRHAPLPPHHFRLFARVAKTCHLRAQARRRPDARPRPKRRRRNPRASGAGRLYVDGNYYGHYREFNAWCEFFCILQA